MRLSYLDRVSVRAKLWLLAGSLMLISALQWGAGYWLAHRLTVQNDALVLILSRAAKAGDLARQAQNDLRIQVQEWKDILLRGHDPAEMAKYRAGFDKRERAVAADLAELKTLLLDLRIPTDRVDKAAQEHRLLGERYRGALATWKARDPLAYRGVDAQLKGIDRPLNVAIGDLAASTFAEAKRLEDQEKTEMAALVRFGGIFKTTLLAVGLVFAFVIAQAVLGRILHAMRAVTRGMERMAAGDFTQVVEVRFGDELGQMAQDFNAMKSRFQGLFHQLRDASDRVASGSTELSATANEVARASGEIARVAEGQRRTSESTAAAMTEFAASIQQVARNARDSQARTEDMVAAAAEGARQGGATVAAMRAIRQAAQEMVKAVRIIQDLARQTNLLALNAAIESAKAGVHGRGFAVVAEEVRKLAERSGAAARQIGDLIQQTEEAMGEGIRTVEATHATIRSLQENMDAVAGSAREIGSATEEQSRTSNAVARQVEDSAQATERSAAASTELAQTVEEVNRTADYLARIAEELSGSLSRFKTA